MQCREHMQDQFISMQTFVVQVLYGVGSNCQKKKATRDYLPQPLPSMCKDQSILGLLLYRFCTGQKPTAGSTKKAPHDYLLEPLYRVAAKLKQKSHAYYCQFQFLIWDTGLFVFLSLFLCFCVTLKDPQVSSFIYNYHFKGSVSNYHFKYRNALGRIFNSMGSGS